MQKLLFPSFLLFCAFAHVLGSNEGSSTDDDAADDSAGLDAIVKRSVPYRDDNISSFTNVYYEALRTEATILLDKMTAEVSSMDVIVLGEGGVVSHFFSERTLSVELPKIQGLFKRWFEIAGKCTDPMNVNVVAYQHPVLVVKGETTYANYGKAYFTQTFFFQSDFVAHSTLIVSPVEPSTALPADSNKSVTGILDNFFAKLDKSSSSLLELFALDAVVFTANRFALDDGIFLRRDQGSEKIKRLLKDNFKPKGTPTTKTDYSILSFHYPEVVVKAVSRDKKNVVVAEFLGAFRFAHLDKRIKIFNGVFAFEWSSYNSHKILDFFSSVEDEPDNN